MEPVTALLSALRSTGSLAEKHPQLLEHGPIVMEALKRAKHMNRIPAPKLGGPTRWCVGHFDSLNYIADNLPTIIRFVSDEITSGTASESVKQCAEVIQEADYDILRKQT